MTIKEKYTTDALKTEDLLKPVNEQTGEKVKITISEEAYMYGGLLEEIKGTLWGRK